MEESAGYEAPLSCGQELRRALEDRLFRTQPHAPRRHPPGMTWRRRAWDRIPRPAEPSGGRGTVALASAATAEGPMTLLTIEVEAHDAGRTAAGAQQCTRSGSARTSVRLFAALFAHRSAA